jgi:polyhydroxyalkanoate synthesis regulator phasin
MTLEAINNYLHVVSGLTKTTRARARAAAKAMLAQAGLDGVATDAGERVGKLAEEIMNAGRANRELLEKVVAAEVDKAAARLGFARAGELESLRQEVDALRQVIVDQQAAASGTTAEPAPANVAAARKVARARKSSSATLAAKKSPGGSAAGQSAAPRKTAARKAAPAKVAPRSARAQQAPAESVGGEDVGG